MTVTIHVGFDARDFSRKSGKLFIADPAGQDGLVPVVAKGTKPVTYLNSYNVADQVHCAFCDTHQRHNRGFTVGLEDGSIALCGNKCAEGFFGRDTARALRADLERRQGREKHLENIARTFAGISDASRHFTDTLVAQEQIGLDLILLLAQILPETAQTKSLSAPRPAPDQNGGVGMKTEGDKASLRMERVTVREIARQVAKEAGVKPAVIFGPGRKQKDFRLRALVCFTPRRHGMSYPRIGMALGRDHCTIRSAVINERRRRGEA